MNSDSFILELVSPYDVPTTVSRVIEIAATKDWQNPATHNLQQSLAKSGKTVRAVQVVEICKPMYSGRMLELSDERIFSVMMPCRISVYEKEDGKTYVALLDAAKLSAGMPPVAASAMADSSRETLEIVEEVIRK